MGEPMLMAREIGGGRKRRGMARRAHAVFAAQKFYPENLNAGAHTVVKRFAWTCTWVRRLPTPLALCSRDKGGYYNIVT